MGRAISRPQAGTLALDSIDGGTAWLGAHNNHVLIATLFVPCRAVALLMFRRARSSELQCFSGGVRVSNDLSTFADGPVASLVETDKYSTAVVYFGAAPTFVLI